MDSILTASDVQLKEMRSYKRKYIVCRIFQNQSWWRMIITDGKLPEAEVCTDTTGLTSCSWTMSASMALDLRSDSLAEARTSFWAARESSSSLWRSFIWPCEESRGGHVGSQLVFKCIRLTLIVRWRWVTSRTKMKYCINVSTDLDFAELLDCFITSPAGGLQLVLHVLQLPLQLLLAAWRLTSLLPLLLQLCLQLTHLMERQQGGQEAILSTHTVFSLFILVWFNPRVHTLTPNTDLFQRTKSQSHSDDFWVKEDTTHSKKTFYPQDTVERNLPNLNDIYEQFPTGLTT